MRRCASNDWLAATRTLAAIAGCYFENMTDTSAPLPERVEAMRVSPGFFVLFGTPPSIGRTFSAEEERLVAPVAVISDGFWARRFARDPKRSRPPAPAWRAQLHDRRRHAGVVSSAGRHDRDLGADAAADAVARSAHPDDVRPAEARRVAGRCERRADRGSSETSDEPTRRPTPAGARGSTPLKERQVGGIEALAVAALRRRCSRPRSPHAATSRACCSPTPRAASTRSPSGSRSVRAAAASSASFGSKGSCSPASARHSGLLDRDGGPRSGACRGAESAPAARSRPRRATGRVHDDARPA